MGACTRGAACAFAHGLEELQPLPDLSKTAMCPEQRRGVPCARALCPYAHSPEELRVVPHRALPMDPLFDEPLLPCASLSGFFKEPQVSTWSTGLGESLDCSGESEGDADSGTATQESAASPAGPAERAGAAEEGSGSA